MSVSKEEEKRIISVNYTGIVKLVREWQTCERMAVNFMRSMTSLHVKQQVLEERINQLEEKIEMKANQEEVNQLREEIKTVREGQLQAMEEKQRELEEKLVMKSSTNYVE